jgi:hypothetical protein
MRDPTDKSVPSVGYSLICYQPPRNSVNNGTWMNSSGSSVKSINEDSDGSGGSGLWRGGGFDGVRLWPGTFLFGD